MSCIDLPPNSREEEVARFTRAKETLIVRGGLVGIFKEDQRPNTKDQNYKQLKWKKWLVQLIKKPSLSEALKELSYYQSVGFASHKALTLSRIIAT